MVVTVAALGSTGCDEPPSLLRIRPCPETITAGDSCSSFHPEVCDDRGDTCGFNGWVCRDGKWRESFTYCNPPMPPPPPPPDAGAAAGDAGSRDAAARDAAARDAGD